MRIAPFDIYVQLETGSADGAHHGVEIRRASPRLPSSDDRLMSAQAPRQLSLGELCSEPRTPDDSSALHTHDYNCLVMSVPRPCVAVFG